MWKRTDVPDALYSTLTGVDVRKTSVGDLRTRVAARLDVDPSLVTPRLVRCCTRKPTANEEKTAVVLDNPLLTLAAAGITGTAWLLVDVVQLTRLAAEREEEAERLRAERRARRGALPVASCLKQYFSRSLLAHLLTRQT